MQPILLEAICEASSAIEILASDQATGIARAVGRLEHATLLVRRFLNTQTTTTTPEAKPNG